MIVLTDEQAQELEPTDAAPPRVTNPRTKETFVLVRVDEHGRIMEDDYDDSPWTREEIEALNWQMMVERSPDEWKEYDEPEEK